MKNLDKYFKELPLDKTNQQCFLFQKRTGTTDCMIVRGNCKECMKDNIKWLLEEYKEVLLSDEAKAYLISVINPFSADDVRSITKFHDSRTKKYNIEIKMIYAVFCFYFEEYSNLDDLFSNLTIGHSYSTEELGLD